MVNKEVDKMEHKLISLSSLEYQLSGKTFTDLLDETIQKGWIPIYETFRVVFWEREEADLYYMLVKKDGEIKE